MDIKEKLELIYKNPHVWSIGDGVRTTQGKFTSEKCAVVGVSKKLPKSVIAAEHVLPREVDVVETGIIRALDLPKAQDVYTDRYRPAPGGVSVGHEKISAGTLGCWVNYNGRKVMLSNNHVLANSNDAKIGDRILQPGPHDGGVWPRDHIAHLTKFEPIHFLGEDTECPFSKAVAFSLNKAWSLFRRKTQFQAVVPHADSNLVDAAIAEPLGADLIEDWIVEIGRITGVIDNPPVGMPVEKCGRTTGFTTGEILQTDVVVQVSYGGAKIAVFQDQLMAGDMSAGGDSGSLVVSVLRRKTLHRDLGEQTSDNMAVGLLFAGSDTTTIFTPIRHVQDIMGISFFGV
jgi:hypothetical protein